MNTTPETRASLLIRVRNPADQAAWHEFVEIYRPIILRLARQKGMQDADADQLEELNSKLEVETAELEVVERKLQVVSDSIERLQSDGSGHGDVPFPVRELDLQKLGSGNDSTSATQPTDSRPKTPTTLPKRES